MSKTKAAEIILAALSSVLAAVKAIINIIKCIGDLKPQSAQT